jgi:hypothetical protein
VAKNVGKTLLHASWLLYAVSLFLPAVRSTTLNATRATSGWEILIAFPLLIVNPISLTHPFLWLYVLTLTGPNLVVLFSQRFFRKSLAVRRSTGAVATLTIAVLSALSPAAGVPSLLGPAFADLGLPRAMIERLLPGYYVWVLSVATAAAAIVVGCRINTRAMHTASPAAGERQS